MRSASKNGQLSKAGNKKIVYVGVGAVAVVAAIVAGVFGTQQGTTPTSGDFSPVQNGQDSEPQGSAALTAENLVLRGAPVLGDPEAEVTIVDFSDFQCTNCRRFATQTEPQIAKDYVDQGKASIVFMHFPVFGPDSVTAGMASMCAHEQNKFWEFHDHLYANQSAANSGWANAASMKEFASEVGLEREQFDSCLDSKKYESYVRADLDLALSSGFPGTPSFIIMKSDGSEAEVLAGAHPYSTFQTMINKKMV